MSTARTRRGTRPVVDPVEGEDPAPFADSRHTRVHVRRGLAGLVVGTLGLLSVGGVWLASAADSTTTDAHSVAVDTTRPDTSKAVPDTTSVQPGTRSDTGAATNPTARTKDGGLAALDGRGSTVSRNAIRTELDQAMSRSLTSQRTSSLATSGTKIIDSAATVTERVRADELNASIAKVKANAAKIAAEKKAAEAKLVAQAKTAGISITSGNLQAIVSDGGGTTPIAPGSYTLGSYWGEYGVWARWHTGEDFVSPCGTPVRAVAAGVVGQPTGGSWAGNHVIIHHANGGSTLSAHLSSIVVSPGATVKAGQLIGYVGETGRAFGCHLHFEYYPAGTTPGDVYSTQDPLVFLRSLGVKP
ncbi:M23 family metallopeptidase [Acidipropionibacterium timonense]|uniref:M23 family metallopeptidase n=1 Tax=Acidipropionibacterium timonense TaxID=2161818 RepID=UPI001436C452|nr:M23 family metallopeptidase [Acidipropionibacterium timonense]